MAKGKGVWITGTMSKGRLENLTDGIFAFAMTLLVLGIEVPSGADVALAALRDANPARTLLMAIYPDLTHFVLAFIMIAAFWVMHHSFCKHVRKIDRKLLWLNIFGLLLVALMPFSTDFADTYVGYPIAAMVFELNVLVLGSVFYLQWAYASKGHRLIRPDLSAADIEHIKHIIAVMPVVSVVAMGAAFMGVTWSVLLFALTPLLYALPLRKLVRG